MKVILAPDPNTLLKGTVPPIDEEAISNVMAEKYILSLEDDDYKIYVRRKFGYTQQEIAEELGFANNRAVSIRLSDIRNGSTK